MRDILAGGIFTRSGDIHPLVSPVRLRIRLKRRSSQRRKMRRRRRVSPRNVPFQPGQLALGGQAVRFPSLLLH